MITKDEIRSIPELYKSIQRDKEQLSYLNEKATSVPSGLSDKERVQTSPNNTAGRYVDAAADLQREIAVKERELSELQKRAKEFIETVKDPFARKILRMRYLKCYTWDVIADLLGYTERHVGRLEAEAVNDLN